MPQTFVAWPAACECICAWNVCLIVYTTALIYFNYVLHSYSITLQYSTLHHSYTFLGCISHFSVCQQWVCHPSAPYLLQRMNFTLSILFSMKSINICIASMFFPPYLSCPPWTGMSINTSRQDTGRLFSRLTAWLETKKTTTKRYSA